MPPKGASESKKPPSRKGAATTLAGVSDAAVGQLLDRRSKKRRNAGNLAATLPTGLAPAAAAAAQAGACGALAVLDRDAPNLIQGETPRPAPGNASDLDDWEDAVGSESSDGGKEAGGMHFELQDIMEQAEGEEGQGKRKKAAPRFSAEDKQLAVDAHRVHLLCLLSRALAMDQAASDPVVQAAALSLMPQQLSGHLMSSPALDAGGLLQTATWFRLEVRTAVPDQDQEASQPATAERLLEVAQAKRGSAEETTALLAALLRAHSLRVRSVRVLDPLPVRPTVKESHLPTFGTAGNQAKRARRTPAKPPPADAPPGTAKRQRGGKKAQQGDEQGGSGDQASVQPKKRQRKSAAGASGKTAKAGAAAEPVEASKPDSEAEGLKEAASKRAGDVEFENQLAMAMQASAAAVAQKEEKSKAAANGPSKTLKSSTPGRPDHEGAAWQRRRAFTGEGNLWLEVFCPGEAGGRWVHLDHLQSWVDKPERVEKHTVRTSKLAYVIALAGGGAKDVTSRYVESMATAEKLRDSAWWLATLEPYKKLEARFQAASVQASQAQGKDKAGASHMQMAEASTAGLHDEDLTEKAEAERVGKPTTIDGFKKHPLYVLERHISRYEALQPGCQLAGQHRGEKYYLRTALQPLHTADRWMREGRQVIEGQQPTKTVRKRGTKDAAPQAPEAQGEDDDDLGEADFQGLAMADPNATKLYGLWQTEVYNAPAALDGRVPKNERGNVQVPPFVSAMPEGTVHLRQPRLGPVCKQLGVDYAPAMMGFEIRGGRSVPVITGVVVCQQHQEAVLLAWEQAEREREEKARQKAAAAAGAFWRRLLAAIFSRARVEAEHNQPAPLQPHLRQPQKASGSAAQAIDLAGDSDGAPMVGEKKQGGRKIGKREGSVAAGPVAVQKEGQQQQQGSKGLAEPERHAADGADCAAVEEEDI